MVLTINSRKIITCAVTLLFIGYVVSILKEPWAEGFRSVITLSSFLLLCLLLVVFRRKVRLLRPLRYMFAVGLLFVLYSAGGMLFLEEIAFGAQNVIAFVCFLLALWLALSVGEKSDAVESAIKWGAVVISVVGAYSVLTNEIGYSSVYYERPMALLAVIISCWSAGKWVCEKKPVYLLVLIVLGTVIVTSLSRASSVLFVLAVILSVRLNKKNIAMATIALCVLVTGFLALSSDDILEAYLSRSSKGEMVKVGDFEINATGRGDVWSEVYYSWLETKKSMVLGHGAGASAYLIASFHEANSPHNEYLRVAHDYGLLGLVLWGYVHFACLLVLLRCARFKGLTRQQECRLLVGRNTMLVYMAAAVVLNPMIFSFITVPAGLLVGLAMKEVGSIYQSSNNAV